jgi:hypothetical protein
MIAGIFTSESDLKSTDASQVASSLVTIDHRIKVKKSMVEQIKALEAKIKTRKTQLKNGQLRKEDLKQEISKHQEI